MSTAITIRNEHLRVLPIDVINIILMYVSHLDDSLWSLQFNTSTGAAKRIVNRYCKYDPLVNSITYKYIYFLQHYLKCRPKKINVQVFNERNNTKMYMCATLTLIEEISDEDTDDIYINSIYKLEGIEAEYNEQGKLIHMKGTTNTTQMQIDTETNIGYRSADYMNSSGSATISGKMYEITHIIQSGKEILTRPSYKVLHGFDYDIFIR